MFELTDQPIDAAALREQLKRPDAGAAVVFEGWVRDHHAGKPVTHLEYEAFHELSRREGDTIVAEAELANPGSTVLCMHRTGTLTVGELAVWIGVTAAHRAEAFLACRQVIEELKRRLPVWKKEHHPDGAAEWVNCTVEAAGRDGSAEHYHERQRSLPEVGSAGQAKLAAADVLVAGVGGLGCPAALYLATSGVGRLTLVDGGRVEVSNLHRQILFTADDVGACKATVAAARLRAQNPFARVEAQPMDLTVANVRALVTGRTAVLDCTDNFATRFLLHDACRAAGVPLIQAAVYRFEGELTRFDPRGPGCLHCLWTGRNAGMLEAQAANCGGGPVFAPAVGLIGVMQASETLKLILGLTSAVSSRQTRLIDLLDGTVTHVERTVNPDCPICGAPPTAATAPVVVPESDAVVVLPDDIATLGVVRRVALLESGETLAAHAEGVAWTAIASNDLMRLREMTASGKVLVACRRGLRSASLARLLRAEGLAGIYALAGGVSLIRPAP